MPRHNKREFAALCGIQTKHLSVYILRGNVVLDENELIDDTHPANLAFLEKQQTKKGKPKNKEKSTIQPSETEADQERVKYIKDQREKLKIDMEARQNDLELQRIKIQRQRGEMIPTESVKKVFEIHTESVKQSYMEASDNLIVVLGQRKEFSPDDISEVRKKFSDIVNRAISNAIHGSNVILDGLVKEFSVKRGVGQHD